MTSRQKIVPGNIGMTLAEVLVVIALFAVIIVAVGAFEANIFTYNSQISGSYQTSQNSQVILKTMAAELREISPSVNGAFPIAVAGSTTISFFSDKDNDGLSEKITYSLTGTVLYRSVIVPSGWPLIYNPSLQSTSTLGTNIINGADLPIFEYFDANYTGTSSPLTQPVSPAFVKLIRVNQKIDLDPNRSPVPIIYTVQINLRNLKTNL